MNNANEIVPFGKYKGQPVEILQQDHAYCEWLMGQGWLQSRFPQLRTIIINNFTEPTETPEHNAMQARFLDKKFAFAVGMMSKGINLFVKAGTFKTPDLHTEFEIDGADVIIRSSSHDYIAKKGHPDFDYAYKQKYDYISELIKETWDSEYRTQQIKKLDDLAIAETIDFVWPPRFQYGIELKPSLGDDYPAVLRQVRNMKAYLEKVIIIGTYTGKGATIDQVRAIFASSKITLLMLDDVITLAEKLV